MDELADAVMDLMREVVVKVVRLDGVADVHLPVRRVHQLVNALPRLGRDRHDGDAEALAQAFNVDAVAALLHLVHEVQRHDHRPLQLQQLHGQIEVALQIRGVDDVDDGVGRLPDDEIARDDLLHRIGRERVDPRQIDHRDGLAVDIRPALFLLYGHARPVADVLIAASQFVEQLSEQSLFYVANVISEEFNTLEKNIKYEDAKKPLAYLKYIIANIKRMNNDYDEAKCLFEEVLAENNLDHEHRLTCMECLGYLYYALDDNKKAVEYANRMMKECKKNDMYNRYIAKYIKAKNGEYDNNEVRLRELQKLYKDLKKTHYRTVTINTLYEIAQYDHSQQTLNKINLGLRKTGLSSYDRMRLISKKYTIMTSPELSQDLTPSDINDVQVVYYYSFMQMLTRMMEESHVILWGFYLNEKNYPELIKLMKYSSFVWEMKDNKDTINEYLDKIRNDVDFMNWIKGNLNDDYVMFLINERGL